MKQINDLNRIVRDMHTKLFNDCKVFFAFSNQQFEENKTELKDGEKYVSIGAGGYLPKGNIEQLNKGFKDIAAFKKQAIKDNKIRRQHIISELVNYECYYLNDISGALEVLPYPKEEVMKVYRETYKKHMEQAN